MARYTDDFIKEFVVGLLHAGADVRAYSGRGMYGRKCVGYTYRVGNTVELQEVVGEMMRAVADGDSPREYCSMLAELWDHRGDSMGLDIIMYWPDMGLTSDQILEWQIEEGLVEEPDHEDE